MNTIAEKSGIRKASLFHHFASKEKLYIEVLATVVSELGVFVQDAGLSEGSFPERLDRLGDMSEAWLGANPTAARLLIWEILGQGAFVQSPAGQAVPLTVREVSRFLAEGMASGDIPKQNPDHLAMSVISIHLLYFAVSPLSNDIFQADIFSQPVMDARLASVREQIRRLCGVVVAS
jgi:AcrR family transcriptional regulator